MQYPQAAGPLWSLSLEPPKVELFRVPDSVAPAIWSLFPFSGKDHTKQISSQQRDLFLCSWPSLALKRTQKTSKMPPWQHSLKIARNCSPKWSPCAFRFIGESSPRPTVFLPLLSLVLDSAFAYGPPSLVCLISPSPSQITLECPLLLQATPAAHS